MNKYEGYYVTVAGGEDPGGAKNLCEAAEEEFSGLNADISDSPHDPAGIILSGPEGANPEICAEIRRWCEAKREKYC